MSDRHACLSGTNKPIVSEALFHKAQEIMQQRVEDLNGRRFHNGGKPLLAGLMKCSRCKSHKVSVSTHKKYRIYPYYLCSKR